MTATCAACNGPIDSGKRQFVIAGSEVLHSACARAGRQTASWRMRAELAAKQEAIARVEEENRRLVAASRDLAANANAKIRELHAAALTQKREIDRLANENNQFMNEMREARALYEAERGMHATAIAEIERMKADRTSSEPTTDDTPVDDSTLRFSLLELQ